MTGVMLRLADKDPGPGAHLENVSFVENVGFGADASARGSVSLPDLRDIVSASVVPRLCRALAPKSPVAGRITPAHDRLGPQHRLDLHLCADLAVSNGAATRATLREFRRELTVVPRPDVQGQVGAAVDCLLANDTDAVCAWIDEMRARGESLERIYLDVLMPAAVHLNGLLADDLSDCAAITIAYLNLHAVLRRFADAFRDEGKCIDTGSRALLASPRASSAAAGLQMFGLLFMAEFFRRDGWDALTERSLTSASFRDAVENQWFDIVQVLASRDEDLDEVASGIRLIRRGARNRDVGIIACGRIFSERPEIISLVGADRSASDLPTGLALARAFVSRPLEHQLLS